MFDRSTFSFSETCAVRQSATLLDRLRHQLQPRFRGRRRWRGRPALQLRLHASSYHPATARERPAWAPAAGCHKACKLLRSPRNLGSSASPLNLSAVLGRRRRRHLSCEGHPILVSLYGERQRRKHGGSSNAQPFELARNLPGLDVLAQGLAKKDSFKGISAILLSDCNAWETSEETAATRMSEKQRALTQTQEKPASSCMSSRHTPETHRRAPASSITAGGSRPGIGKDTGRLC